MTEGKEVVWTVTDSESFEQDHLHSLLMRSYGLDKIMRHIH